MKSNKGFTLIELLVVIAIIGILSGIVLTSLNSARGKAEDAKVKADLSGLRSAAEIYYSDNNDSYGSAASCAEGMFADDSVSPYLRDALGLECVANGQTYAVSATLENGSFCVDSSGSAEEDYAISEDGSCKANQ